MIQQFQSWAYIWKKTIPWEDSCTPMFTAAEPTIAKTWEQPNCPSRHEWIKKMYLLIHREWTPLRHLKNEIMPFAAAWMNLEINILMEVDRKRKTIFLWYHPYVESKRNISMKQEQTHRHREQASGCQGGKDWELGISRWNLFIHRMDKEWGPTYGTEKFIQYLGINQNGKEYTCWAESICCTAEINYTSIHFFNF